MRYALKFGYNGRGFSGYAMQPNLRTVEGDIIEALKEAKVINQFEDSRFQSASRTDKGVSAKGNVIALSTDFRKPEILGALNAHLEDIWFYGLAEVDEEFNPRHARTRWYRYFLIEEEIEMENIRKAALLFEGEHDFSNFARIEDKDPVRVIENIEITREGGLLLLDFRAQSFLWHMVRRIVMALVRYAKVEITLGDIKNALEAKEKMDLGIAPPEPLILIDIEYDFDIPVDHDQIENARSNIQKLLNEMKIQETIMEYLLGI